LPAPRSPIPASIPGPGSEPAATAEVGAGSGVSPGRGTPRGRGSNGRRRRRWGRGGAPLPGAAPRGAGVQTGTDGEGRAGAGHPTRARRPTGSGFRPAVRSVSRGGVVVVCGRRGARGPDGGVGVALVH